MLPLWGHDLPDAASGVPPWFVAPLAVPAEQALGPDPTLEQVIHACGSFAATLAELHRRGISHRDVKPDNLFEYRSNWLVGDFGLVDFPDKTPVTQDGERVGPMHFIAPEMVTDADTADGAPADVYSLAKTLWVLATRQRVPLPGPHRRDDPAYQIRSYRCEPGAEQLDTLLAAATAIDPKARIKMAEFAAELRAWGQPLVRRAAEPGDLSYLKGVVGDLLRPAQEERARREGIMRLCEEGQGRLVGRLTTVVMSLGKRLEVAFPVGYLGSGVLSDRARTYFPDSKQYPLLNPESWRSGGCAAQAMVDLAQARHTFTAAAAIEYTWVENIMLFIHK